MIEKLRKNLAKRYAKNQKFKKELNKIKYGKESKPKMPTGKKLTIFLITNFTLVEIFSLFIMFYLRDISSLSTLISCVVGEVMALAIYQFKSLKENTSDTGFMYELKMKESKCNEENSVG